MWTGSDIFMTDSHDLNPGGLECMPNHSCKGDGMRRITVKADAVGLDWHAVAVEAGHRALDEFLQLMPNGLFAGQQGAWL